MAKNPEVQSGTERKGRFLRAWKNFNKVSAAVLAAAGVIFESPLLLGLAAIDLAQVGIAKWLENRKKNKKATKMGGFALAKAGT